YTNEKLPTSAPKTSGSTLTINGQKVDEIAWLKTFIQVREADLRNPRESANRGGNYWAQTTYRTKSYAYIIGQGQFMFGRSVRILDNDGKPIRLADMGTIRGTNIGGVFLIEPFIRPSLFDQFNTSTVAELPVDEWTFSAALGKAEARRQLEEHWDTFVTRDHLEEMA
ncbi:hypothetical protein IWQ56_007316, partial [Coemansia nantahalensis]